jgi:hypothetical protein
MWPIRTEFGRWSHHLSHHVFSSCFLLDRVVSAHPTPRRVGPWRPQVPPIGALSGLVVVHLGCALLCWNSCTGLRDAHFQLERETCEMRYMPLEFAT